MAPCGEAESTRAREHVWVSLMPWWHAAFAATVAGTAAWSAAQLWGSWKAPADLALYAVLALVYVLTPSKFSGGWARLVYLVGAFGIFIVANFVFPGAGFLMFILIPQCYILLDGVRPAFVAVIGLVTINAGADLYYSGLNTASVASVSAFGVLSLVLALLLGGYISRIIEQSKQRAALIEELERTRAELAEVSRESGALAERERLAREIHDALAQGFTSVVMLAQAAQASLDRDDLASARRQLGLAEAAAREGLAEARSLIGTLAPLALQGASLVGAVERVCADLGLRFGFAARLEVHGEERPISHNAEIVLLRAAQVALVNVGRHAKAGSAAVKLVFGKNSAALEVADGGVGFDAVQSAGFGLSQLRSRIAELGGTTDIRSAPGQGTVVSVTLPLPVEAPSPAVPSIPAAPAPAASGEPPAAAGVLPRPVLR